MQCCSAVQCISHLTYTQTGGWIVDVCRSSPQPPTVVRSQKSKAQPAGRTPTAPRPFQVPGLGRHLLPRTRARLRPPFLSCTVLGSTPYARIVCPCALGPPAYLIDRSSTRLPSPGPASPLPHPLLATARCTHCTAQLHQSVLSSSSNSSFPPLHIPIQSQSNPPSSPFIAHQYLSALLAEPQS